MTYKKILVAVDMTDEAEQVLEAARKLAEGRDSEVAVVTVMRPLTEYYTNYNLFLETGEGQRVEEQALRQTTVWLSELAKQYGIDANAVNVVVGKPAVEIRKLAEQLGVDLIVVGTHGRHGIGLMLGSTANAVLHGTQCSVLAVRISEY